MKYIDLLQSSLSKEKSIRNFTLAPLALAVALTTASYAQAQTTDDEEEQAEPAAESSGEGEMEEILVRGVKQSLQLAVDLKKNSDSIIDAIVAEDIGKLPDQTAAESIARIPGVQVTRWNDEASGILIRGLPDVTTTYNGREFFVAEQRRAALQDFPSQALAGIEVYKSGTADLIEPGLAGLVNVRTRRPFDFEGQKIAGGVHWGYNDQSEQGSPAGNILYSNRWDTDAGEFGFLANATYAENKYYNGVRYNATWFPQAAPWWNIEEPYSEGNFVLPASVGLYNSSGDRWRPSYNIAAQWRPNENLEIYFDGIYQGYRNQSKTDNFWFGMTEWDWLHWDGNLKTPENNGGDLLNTTDPVLRNLAFVEGTDNHQVASVTKSGGLPPQAWRSTSRARTDTFQYALGAILDTDSVHTVVDLAFTDSSYKDDAWSFDTGANQSYTVNADFFGDYGVLFSHDPEEWDPTDPDTWQVRGYYESEFDVGGKSWQFRTDFTIDTGWGNWLHEIKTGFRYNDREATRQGNDRYSGFWSLFQTLPTVSRDLQVPPDQACNPTDAECDPDNPDSVIVPLVEVGFLDLESTFNPFRTGKQGFNSYVMPTLDSIQSHTADLEQLALDAALALGDINNAARWGVQNGDEWTAMPIQKDPVRDWRATEESYAIYIQTKSHFDIGSVGVDLFAGVRATQTEATNSGTSTVFDQETGERIATPRSVSNDYINVLPNISLAVDLTEKLRLRVGYTETQTKPNFGDMNPSLNLTQLYQDPDADPYMPEGAPPGQVVNATASGGNPDLEPLESKNYDISLEYYFSKTGYISAAAFYRDLYGFTNWTTRFVEIEPYGLVQYNRPENAGEGEIEGWELAFTTFLDFEGMPEFFHDFGFNVNTTYLDGQTRLPMQSGTGQELTFGDFVDIPGLSKHTYNLAIWYEAHKFSARLSWNMRETWTNWYNFPPPPATGINRNVTLKRERLDFSMSYDINDNFSVYFDVANILADPFKNFTELVGTNFSETGQTFNYPQDVRDEGRYYGGGFRFSF